MALPINWARIHVRLHDDSLWAAGHTLSCPTRQESRGQPRRHGACNGPDAVGQAARDDARSPVAVPRDRVRLRPSPSKWTSFRVRTPEQGPKSHSAGAVGKNLPPDSGSASGRAVVAGSALRARWGTRYARGGASRPRRARQPKLFGRAARVLCLRFSSTGAWRGTKLWCERRAAGAEPGCRTG